MTEALAYWDHQDEISHRQAAYSARQRGSLILRIMEQLALPIEAAMADEWDEQPEPDQPTTVSLCR